ncbi:MAG: hypothetical protein ABIP75_09890 [Pyrinomonadaceae bacterium]
MQLTIYLAMTIWPDRFYSLFYLNPRLGLHMLELVATGREGSMPGVFQWLAAGWIFALGVLLLSGRSLIKTYLVSEILLSLPNVMLIIVTLTSNLSPLRGLTIRETFIPLLVMTIYSVIPLVLAWRARRPKRLGWGVAC